MPFTDASIPSLPRPIAPLAASYRYASELYSTLSNGFKTGLLSVLALMAIPVPGQCAGHPLQSWTVHEPATAGRQFHAVTYARGRWVAVGNLIVQSTNAVQWSGDALANQTLRTVLWDGSSFIAAGSSSVAGSLPPLYASTDGIDWRTQRVLNSRPGTFHAGSVGPNGPVLVGDHGLVARQVSTDQWDWEFNTGPNQPTNHLYAITHGVVDDGQSRYIAVGNGGAIWISGGGGPARWTKAATHNATTNDLFGITYGGGRTSRVPHGNLIVLDGRFVAVGDRIIQTSRDGINWTPATLPIDTVLRRVDYQAGHFVAIGDNGRIVYSANGEDWTQVNTGLTSSLSGLCYSGRTFVVSSITPPGQPTIPGGALLQSNPILGFDRPPRKLSSQDSQLHAGLWEIELMTELGRTYRLESTADLARWDSLGEFEGVGERVPVIDLSRPESAQRFYRVRLP